MNLMIKKTKANLKKQIVLRFRLLITKKNGFVYLFVDL